MPRPLLLLFAALVLLAVQAANVSANQEEMIRLAQCMEDNAAEKATPDVIQKYCNCMNRKMGVKEKLSVSEWERIHLKERFECDKEAGWR